MRMAVIGGVRSTQILLERLVQHGFNEIRVWGYSPRDPSLVSGWVDMAALCQELEVAHSCFVRVSECSDALRAFSPDILFVVGLSQIVPREILNIPSIGSVGFHPTALPKGRGRAAIAWMVLEGIDGAATFFLMRDGIDDGPILVQEPFEVDSRDDAASVEAKVLEAESAALNRLLPQLSQGYVDGIEQDHSQASWLGRRTQDDGCIDWRQSASAIVRLIRASTNPHPGAFTFDRDTRITIWAASVDYDQYKGVVGRILRVLPEEEFVVQCGEGLVLIQEWQAGEGWFPRVGTRLGYHSEIEIFRLRAQMQSLEERLARLEALVSRTTPAWLAP